jgi:hypothetical protein
MIGNVTALLAVFGCCKRECAFLSLFVGVIPKKKKKKQGLKWVETLKKPTTKTEVIKVN